MEECKLGSDCEKGARWNVLLQRAPFSFINSLEFGLFTAHLSFLEFLSKMGSLRAFYARKFPIFDIFPRPVRGGVMGGVKERAYFEILTKKAQFQSRGAGAAGSLVCLYYHD
jgi:hypothetical protein